MNSVSARHPGLIAIFPLLLMALAWCSADGAEVPVITWAAPAAIVPGTALSATQLDAQASVAGTFAYTPTAGTVLATGPGQPLAVVFTPSDATDYTTASATVAITVGSPDLTLAYGGWQAAGAGVNATGWHLGSYGTDVILGGDFTASGSSPVVGLAAWNGATWNALGSGLTSGNAGPMTDFNARLYMCGDFGAIGGVTSSSFASWNGTAWQDESDGVFGSQPTDGVAAYNGTLYVSSGSTVYQQVAGSWQSIGGADNRLRLFSDATGLLASGQITTIDGVTVNGFARWDGTSWHDLGGGLNSGSGAYGLNLLRYQGNLIAFGEFSVVESGAVTGNDIAWLDGSTWRSIGGSVATQQEVISATVLGGDLVICGDFTKVGTLPASNIAWWDGVAWHAFGSGSADGVTDVLATGTTLWASGGFPSLDGVGATNVAYWTPGYQYLTFPAITDQTVGGAPFAPGATASSGLTPTYTVLSGPATSGDGLITVTGSGTVVVEAQQAGDAHYHAAAPLTQDFQASLPVVSWSTPNGISFGTPLGALQLDASASVPGTFVYTPAAGTVLTPGSQTLNVVFTTSQGAIVQIPASTTIQVGSAAVTITALNVVSPAGSPLPPLTYSATGLVGSDAITSLTESTTATSSSPAGMYPITVSAAVFAPGNVTTYAVTYVPGVLTLTAPSVWQSLTDGGGTDGRVLATLTAGTDLYVSGDFTQVGGVAANGIARFDGSAWHALGTGLGQGPPGMSSGQGGQMAMIDGILYVSGYFGSAGGVPALDVASWDGTSWHSLGAGLPHVPESACVYRGKLVVGGGTPPWVATWDGTSWTTIGSGTGGWVYSLLPYQGGIVAAGDLATFGGVSSGIAFWNGSAWSGLGSGLSSIVAGLGTDGVTLYATGNFNSPAHVAQWDGTSWSGLDGGFDHAAGGGICCGDGLVFFGDLFATAGGLATGNTATWNGTSWADMGGGTDGEIFALSRTSTGVVVGGRFYDAGVAYPGDNLVLYPVAWSDGGATAGMSVAPRVTAISPGTIPATAGAVITLSGTNLLGSSATIGGLPATTIACSETQVTLAAPACPPGSASLLVSTQTGFLNGGTLMVAGSGQQVPTITWGSPAAITYGTALSATQLDATASVPGVLTYAPGAGAVLPAGTATVAVTFVPTDSTTYSGTTARIALTVTPAPLTITATSLSRVAGTPNPALTDTVTGLVGSDALGGVVLTTSAVTDSPAGSYPITVGTVTFASGVPANYAITAVPGTLTITAASGGAPAIPVITGVLGVAGQVSQPFSYQIEASNSPTSYIATPLPAGLSCDPLSGLITGTPTATGQVSVALTATNASGAGTATLVIVITSASSGGSGCGSGGAAGVVILLGLGWLRRQRMGSAV